MREDYPELGASEIELLSNTLHATAPGWQEH